MLAADPNTKAVIGDHRGSPRALPSTCSCPSNASDTCVTKSTYLMLLSSAQAQANLSALKQRMQRVTVKGSMSGCATLIKHLCFLFGYMENWGPHATTGSICNICNYHICATLRGVLMQCVMVPMTAYTVCKRCSALIRSDGWYAWGKELLNLGTQPQPAAHH